MPSLDDLPQELNDAILRDLDVTSLIAVVQVNKAMRAAAIPSLYREVTLLFYDGFPVVARIDKFLRALLETPTHAAHVKKFKLQARRPTRSYASDKRSIPAPEPWTDALRQKTTDMLNRSQLNDPLNWEMAICDEHNTSAQLAFIVARLRNLQSLTVDTTLTLSYGDWLSGMLEHSFSHVVTREHWTRFDRLTHVQLGKGDEIMINHMSTRVIKLALALPRLANLCLWRAVDLKQQDVDGQVTAGHLVTLRLEDTTIRSGVLERITQENRSLRRLSCNYHLPANELPLELDGLRQAISHTNKSLVNLSVRCIPYVNEGSLEIESIPSVVSGNLGSFKLFEKLTKIDISLFVLYGQETRPEQTPPLGHLLPSTLKRLVINDDLWGFHAFGTWTASFFFSKISAYLSNKAVSGYEWRRVTPNLLSIVFDFRSNIYMLDWEDEYTSAVRNMCESQGLRFTILLADEEEW